jgi:hypothetical protein
MSMSGAFSTAQNFRELELEDCNIYCATLRKANRCSKFAAALKILKLHEKLGFI